MVYISRDHLALQQIIWTFLTFFTHCQLVRIIRYNKLIPFKCIYFMKSYFMMLDGLVRRLCTDA